MYKILSKADLYKLVETLQEQLTVYTAVRQGDFAEFKPYNYSGQVELLSVGNTRYPPKSLFLPQSEAMFRVQDADYESVEAEVSPSMILGVRACDARAIQLLDGVFMAEDYRDPYWAKRRAQTTLVVLGCAEPCDTCFCTTVGSGPFDKRAADVMLTEVGDEYVAELRNGKGQTVFGSLADASQEQVDAARQVQTTAASKMKKSFETEGVRDKLYSLFDSDFWFEVQQSCLGCGVCTFLCPTCHCFDIVDEVQRRERVRNWDTCMFRIYSQEASGHNPRPTNMERTRQRIMHKYAYFVDLFDEIGCTGCGRCVRSCPVDLDIRHIIHSAQMLEAS